MANRSHKGRCFRARRATTRRKLRQLFDNKPKLVLAMTAVEMGLAKSLAQAAQIDTRDLGFMLKTGWRKQALKEARASGVLKS